MATSTGSTEGPYNLTPSTLNPSDNTHLNTESWWEDLSTASATQITQLIPGGLSFQVKTS